MALPIILLLPLRNILEDRRRTFNHGSGGVLCVAFSPDGSTLVSGGQATKLWDVKTRTLLRTLKQTTFSIVFSPDGETLTGSSYDMGTWLVAKAWDIQSGKEKANWTIPGTRVAAPERVVLSPDSKKIAVLGVIQDIGKYSGKYSPQIKAELRKAHGGVFLRRLPGVPDGQAAAFSSNSRMLAIGGNSIEIWDIQTGKILSSFGGGSMTWSLAFSPDGKILASGGAGEQSEVRLWDVQTGQLMHTLVGHLGPIKPLAFSPDGKLLASGNSLKRYEVRLWDVQTGALQSILTAHKDKINSLAFSPDGSALASGSADGTVKLWRIK